MRNLVSCGVVAVLLLAAGPALAKRKPAGASDPTDRPSKEREARKACLEGDFTKGISILSELFVDTKNPIHIFNQGRCYQQNERYREAISRFREYMRTDPGDASVAEKYIAECEELAAKREPPAPPPPQPVPAAPAAPSPEESQAQVVASAETPPPPTTSAGGSGLGVAGLVVGGVGLVAVGAGVALNLKANNLAKSIEPPNTYERSTETSRKNYQTFSWVSYGVGAAAIVTGAILCGVGWSRGSNSKDVALIPVVGPGLAGAAMKGAF